MLWPTKVAARAQKTQSCEDEPVDDDPSKPLPYSETGARADDIWGRRPPETRAFSTHVVLFSWVWREEGDKLDICGGAGAGVRASIGAQGPFSEEYSTVINGNPTSALGLIKVFRCTVNLQRRLH